MSDHEHKEKKKSRDIFGAIGDNLYDAHEGYRSFWWDMWSYKYGLIGAVIAVIYFFGPDIFANGLVAVIIFGVILTYVLLHYYVYEIEADEESTLHKVMSFINTICVIVVVCAMLYFLVVVWLYAFRNAGIIG